MNRFADYLQEKFSLKDSEIQSFFTAAKKPLKKSIRINTDRISVEDFKTHAEKKWWILTPSKYSRHIFYIDRTHDLSTALGSTAEHIMGWFYIQEVAAGVPPVEMAADTISEEKNVILDMCSSPGGKTSELSSFFPNSTIIANESNKQRLPQLFTNLERMHCKNVCVVNYDGRFFTRMPEIFDKILLDAPCSGEGTAYKNEKIFTHWHIKNIKTIGKLQKSLFLSALISTKTHGEILYSTCTLNREENEAVIEKIEKKYPDTLKRKKLHILPGEYEKRFWPHIDHTGWFFLTKLEKTTSLPSKKNPPISNNLVPANSHNKEIIFRFLEEKIQSTLHKKDYFYTYGNEVFVSSVDVSDLLNVFFFYRVWVPIGKIIEKKFIPNYHVGIFYGGKLPKHILSESEEKKYLAGENIPENIFPEYGILETSTWVSLGLTKYEDGVYKNLITKKIL